MNNLATWRLRENRPENAVFELGAFEGARLSDLGALAPAGIEW